jgi:peptidoglycan/LPS O-acetylase OafA/YrhL
VTKAVQPENTLCVAKGCFSKNLDGCPESRRGGSNKVEVASATSDHLASLDGLRAISIALVLFGHLNGTRRFFDIDPGIGDYAHLGVLVFFVISGFLITNLLLLEHRKTGQISLKLFYARRSIRIFPSSYCFLACISILWLAGIVHLHGRDLLHAATYTVNYLPNASWQIGHLWSLSVEEQFYLLWPFAVVALKPQRAFWAAGAGILIGPVARIAAWFFFRGTPYRDLAMFPMVADSLATGCLLAIARRWLESQGWYLRMFSPAFSISLVCLILLVNRYLGYTAVAVFGTSIINVCVAVLIHRSVYCHQDFLGQVLNWRPVAFVGVLSYSLYVWQQPFLDRHSAAWVNEFPQNLAFVILASLASYFLLEKPMLKLRHRLRP